MAALPFYPVSLRFIRRVLTDPLDRTSRLSRTLLISLILLVFVFLGVSGVSAASEQRARERQMTTCIWERRRAEAEERITAAEERWQPRRWYFEERLLLVNAQWEAEREGFEAQVAEVAVPRELFGAILNRIQTLSPAPT